MLLPLQRHHCLQSSQSWCFPCCCCCYFYACLLVAVDEENTIAINFKRRWSNPNQKQKKKLKFMVPSYSSSNVVEVVAVTVLVENVKTRPCVDGVVPGLCWWPWWWWSSSSRWKMMTNCKIRIVANNNNNHNLLRMHKNFSRKKSKKKRKNSNAFITQSWAGPKCIAFHLRFVWFTCDSLGTEKKPNKAAGLKFMPPDQHYVFLSESLVWLCVV